MKVLIIPEVRQYFYEIQYIMYEKDYFSYYEDSERYIEELIYLVRHIENNHTAAQYL